MVFIVFKELTILTSDTPMESTGEYNFSSFKEIDIEDMELDNASGVDENNSAVEFVRVADLNEIFQLDISSIEPALPFLGIVILI